MPRGESARFQRLIKSDRPSSEVAKILGVTPRTIQRYRAAGQINPKTGKPKEARRPAKRVQSKLPARLPRRKPYTGKDKARKADRRVKRNTAARVEGARRLGPGGSHKVKMRATYDFYGSDARHRTVTFDLTPAERDELAAMMETLKGEPDGGAAAVSNWLVTTRRAGYMNECSVYNVEKIQVL
jgi:hypothetical protein